MVTSGKNLSNQPVMRQQSYYCRRQCKGWWSKNISFVATLLLRSYYRVPVACRGTIMLARMKEIVDWKRNHVVGNLVVASRGECVPEILAKFGGRIVWVVVVVVVLVVTCRNTFFAPRWVVVANEDKFEGVTKRNTKTTTWLNLRTA